MPEISILDEVSEHSVRLCVDQAWLPATCICQANYPLPARLACHIVSQTHNVADSQLVTCVCGLAAIGRATAWQPSQMRSSANRSRTGKVSREHAMSAALQASDIRMAFVGATVRGINLHSADCPTSASHDKSKPGAPELSMLPQNAL